MMGIYHYAMFVYSVRGNPLHVDPDDFYTYPFAEAHPQYKYRVQKLRVEECFRVPRLCGFTMPSVNDVEGQAMFKSVLLRPLRVLCAGLRLR